MKHTGQYSEAAGVLTIIYRLTSDFTAHMAAHSTIAPRIFFNHNNRALAICGAATLENGVSWPRLGAVWALSAAFAIAILWLATAVLSPWLGAGAWPYTDTASYPTRKLEPILQHHLLYLHL